MWISFELAFWKERKKSKMDYTYLNHGFESPCSGMDSTLSYTNVPCSYSELGQVQAYRFGGTAGPNSFSAGPGSCPTITATTRPRTSVDMHHHGPNSNKPGLGAPHSVFSATMGLQSKSQFNCFERWVKGKKTGVFKIFLVN